jgi:antitoxin component YwqK of YwqJK toxin-antitoxin module
MCNYVNDKLNGEYKRYYSNGQLHIICTYVNDLENGTYKEYLLKTDSIGELKEICNCVNGKKEDGTTISIINRFKYCYE